MVKRVFRYGAAFSICIIFSSFLLSLHVHAQTNGKLRVAPAVQEVILKENEKSKDILITYTNNTGKDIQLSLSSMDFKQSDDLGKIGFLSESSGYSYSLSSFLSLQADEVQLRPEESKQVVVRIENRQDISPGGHYAAIVAKINSDAKQGATAISPSISSLILVNKQGGERYNLSLKSVGWPDGPVVFSLPKTSVYTFQNEGNVHLVPHGRVDVSDMFHRPLAKGVVNESSARVFPESIRQILVQYYHENFVLPVSILTIRTQGDDSLHKTQFSHRDVVLYIHPAVILFILGLGVLAGWMLRRKRTTKK